MTHDKQHSLGNPPIRPPDTHYRVKTSIVSNTASWLISALKLVQSSNRTFEWKRTVEGFDVIVELFVPVDTPDQGGRIQRKPIAKGGSDLTALGIYGLEYIERDLEEIVDEGPLLDDKGIKIESIFEGDERIREMREAAGIVQEFVRLAIGSSVTGR